MEKSLTMVVRLLAHNLIIEQHHKKKESREWKGLLLIVWKVEVTEFMAVFGHRHKILSKICEIILKSILEVVIKVLYDNVCKQNNTY